MARAIRVSAAELPTFLAHVRDRYWPEYEIKHIGPTGKIEAAPPKPDQFPLLYRMPRIEEVFGLLRLA